MALTNPGARFSFVISGQCPSKKNTYGIRRFGRGRASIGIGASPEYEAWEKNAALELKIQQVEGNVPMMRGPTWLCAKIYWKWSGRGGRPDLSNLIQSVEDAVERSGVIKNDFQIESLDGSRRIIITAGEPRVELFVQEVMEGAP